jgi:heptaprenyl diphosphate synthase
VTWCQESGVDSSTCNNPTNDGQHPEPLPGGSISPIIRDSEGQRRRFFIAFLATMAIFLSIVEAVIPRPLPWMRIGLTNAVTLYAFSVLRPREVIAMILVRVTAASLLLGTFLSFGFLLSLVSALSSFLVMYGLYAMFSSWFSLVGISIAGAVASNAAQLLVVNLLFIGSSLAYYFLPFLFLFALFGGAVTGLFGRFLTENL